MGDSWWTARGGALVFCCVARGQDSRSIDLEQLAQDLFQKKPTPERRAHMRETIIVDDDEMDSLLGDDGEDCITPQSWRKLAATHVGRIALGMLIGLDVLRLLPLQPDASKCGTDAANNLQQGINGYYSVLLGTTRCYLVLLGATGDY